MSKAPWREQAEAAALILAFPVLIGLGILLFRYNQKNKVVRRRLAELDEAETEVGCD